MNKFKTFLSKEFDKKDISQNKFAESLGISSYYLGQMLKGEKGPPDRELQMKISKQLELSDSKKRYYFDLIANEKKDIPTDIYESIFNHSDKWNEIRDLLEKEIKNEY